MKLDRTSLLLSYFILSKVLKMNDLTLLNMESVVSQDTKVFNSIKPIEIYNNVAIGNENVNSVNARDLHKALESKQDFSTWIKARIEKLGLTEGVDFLLHNFVEQTKQGVSGGGHNKIDYYVTIDIAKHIAMLEATDKGREVRKYFIECEKKLQQNKQFTLPQTYAEALLEAGRLALENEKLITEAKENAPKVKAFNELMQSKDAIDFLTFSKIINIGRTKLFAKLRELEILRADNTPYQRYIDNGYFRVIESSYTQNDTTRIYAKTMILPKGQKYLANKLKG